MNQKLEGGPPGMGLPSLPFRTGRRTITETDIVNFAGFSGDFGPYHMDHPTARGGQFEGPILHGAATLSIVTGLVVQSGLLRMNGSDPFAFLGMHFDMKEAVRVGDTLQVVVSDLLERPSASQGGCFVVVMSFACVNQHDSVVLSGEWTSLQRGSLRGGGHNLAPER